MAFIEQEAALAVKILVSATVSYKSARLNSALTGLCRERRPEPWKL